jgi:hypothetical protein
MRGEPCKQKRPSGNAPRMSPRSDVPYYAAAAAVYRHARRGLRRSMPPRASHRQRALIRDNASGAPIPCHFLHDRTI